MINKKNRGIKLSQKVKVTLVFVLVIVFSFVLQQSMCYDFSASNKHYYDIVFIAPKSLLAVGTWYAFMTFLLMHNYHRHEGSTSKYVYVLIALLSAMPYLMEIAANPQSIWARDVYLHGRIRFLDISGKLEELEYNYPKQYPSFFILLYVLYVLSGYSDIRHVNLFLLYPAMMITLTLVLFMLYRIFLKNHYVGSALGVMIAVSLLMNNHNELTFQHANTRLYSLILLMFSLLLLISASRKRSFSLKVLFLLISLALSFSHILFPLIIVATIPILMTLSVLLSIKRSSGILRRDLFIILAIVALAYSSWTFYNYYTFCVVEVGLRTFFDYYYRSLGEELVFSSLTIRESLPWFGMVSRNFFKISIIFLTILAGTFIVKHVFRKRGNFSTSILIVWSSYIVATIIVFGLTIFSASLGNSINRGLITFILLIVPYSIAQILELFHMRETRKKIVKFVVFAAVVSLGLNQFVLLHEGPSIVSNTLPLDVVCSFLTNFNANNTLVTSSPFLIYYTYFTPNTSFYKYIEDLGRIETITEISEFYMHNQGIKVLDFRTIVYWSLRYESYFIGLSEWVEFVLIPLHTSSSLIYNDGGNTWVYYGYESNNHAFSHS